MDRGAPRVRAVNASGTVRPVGGVPSGVFWRRRMAAAGAVVLVVLGVAAAAGAFSGDETDAAPGRSGRAAAAAKPALPELPRGGRAILPEYRVIAYYGAPQSTELGALGIGTPNVAARRLAAQARPYARSGRPVLPAMELITVVANADAGADGMYRTRQPDAIIGRYLRAARRHKMLLVLDLQPGHSDFFRETVRLERWLREPDVGLALDPEWRMTDGQVPGQAIGRVEAREVNATSAWLAQLVVAHQLPEKLFVLHQFTDDMVDDTALKPRPGLDMVLNADGFGGRAIKKAKYRAFSRAAPSFHHGFKLFYEEDTNLMRPRGVLRLRPAPDVVVYE
jgi:hypothetical protein